MKQRKHLQTDFIKFILEKYSQGQELPDDDEVEMPDTDEPQTKKSRIVEFEEDEKDTDEEPQSDDEIIDELLNEYKRLKRLKKQNESNRLLNRRKR